MKARKVLAIFACAALLVAATVGATLAYLTDQKSVTNTFTVGNVAIKLDEPAWNEEVAHVAVPGAEFDKDPTVTNIGANDAWVRVNVTLSDWSAFSTAAAAHSITDLTTVFGGFETSKWTLADTPAVDTTNDTVTYSYYYNTKLTPTGETATTGALFTKVTIPGVFTEDEMAAINGNDKTGFTITVTADAIQADGFTTPALAFAAFDDQKAAN